MHCLDELKKRFPRLQDVKDFSYSEFDYCEKTNSPAGEVEAVYFYNRDDFKKAINAIVYKDMNHIIPDSMGAMFIGGLIDHVAEEKTSILILSRGPYSAVSTEQIGLSDEEWQEKSLIIRKNHEIAHFVQRKLFPENKDAMRDEIKADMVGIKKAFGNYDTELAKIFLGIEDKKYREGGRLENYLSNDYNIDELSEMAKEYICEVSSECVTGRDAFDDLVAIESKEKERVKGNE